MSTKDLFLELGDIIQINAPSNQTINENIYIIDYLDDKIMHLIDDKTLDRMIININEDGKLSEESIESIVVLSRSEEKGYARQNNLLPKNWVSVHIGGDIPIIMTGQITNLEEDMIEITIWPTNEKIYIDFGYQGIPLDIPFEKILLREEPAKSTLQQIKEDDEGLEEKEEEVEEDEEVVDVRIQELLLEADEIVFGDELDEITEIVNVPLEERRYDIQDQKTDMLDDMLSIIPPLDRTRQKIDNVHIMIDYVN